jgi:hypothetical protein
MSRKKVTRPICGPRHFRSIKMTFGCINFWNRPPENGRGALLLGAAKRSGVFVFFSREIGPCLVSITPRGGVFTYRY